MDDRIDLEWRWLRVLRTAAGVGAGAAETLAWVLAPLGDSARRLVVRAFEREGWEGLVGATRAAHWLALQGCRLAGVAVPDGRPTCWLDVATPEGARLAVALPLATLRQGREGLPAALRDALGAARRRRPTGASQAA